MVYFKEIFENLKGPSGFQVIMQPISYFLGTLYYILLKKGLSTNMPLENNGNSTCHAQILVGFIANFEVVMLYIAQCPSLFELNW